MAIQYDHNESPHEEYFLSHQGCDEVQVNPSREETLESHIEREWQEGRITSEEATRQLDEIALRLLAAQAAMNRMSPED